MSADPQPQSVTVILVNWNGAEFLPPCLDSIAAQDHAGPIRVLMVDNGSTDGSVELVQKTYPDVTVVENHENNYAAANNLGVDRASSEFVLLLNTDTVLQPDTVRLLVDVLAAHPSAAGVAPKILYPDGRLYSTGVLEREDLYWVDRQQGEPDRGGQDLAEAFGLSGCCVLYRREDWLTVGGLDEDFHMYYEDVDLSLRLRAAGRQLFYQPAATIEHVGHGSIDKTDHGKDQLGERNRLLVLARHYPDRFATECVRSPWFQSAPPAELRDLLPKIASRLGKDGASTELELMLALRDQVRGLVGEQSSRYGEHRNYPRILAEREAWICKLLREVARLRIYRLPGYRLKPQEREFLQRIENGDDGRTRQ